MKVTKEQYDHLIDRFWQFYSEDYKTMEYLRVENEAIKNRVCECRSVWGMQQQRNLNHKFCPFCGGKITAIPVEGGE